MRALALALLLLTPLRVRAQACLQFANQYQYGCVKAGDWATFNGKSGTGTCAAHTFETADAASGPTCTQPALSDVLPPNLANGIPNTGAGGLNPWLTPATPLCTAASCALGYDTAAHAFTTNTALDAASFKGQALTGNVPSGGNTLSYSSGAGAWTPAALNLAGGANYVTGTLGVGNGGTGVASVNLGELLYGGGGTSQFSSITTIAKGSVLASFGVSVAPVWTAQGAAHTTLHGNGALIPTFVADDLTADVTGTLGVGNGGTGAATLTTGSLLCGNGASAVQNSSTNATTGRVLITSGATACPGVSLAATDYQVIRMAAGATNLSPGAIDISQSAAVTGTLGVGNGGTGIATAGLGDLILGGGGTSAFGEVADVALGSTLLSGGVGANEKWSAQGAANTVLQGNGAADPTFTGSPTLSGSLTVSGTASSIAQPAWTACDFTNANCAGNCFQNTGGAWLACASFKDSLGVVHIRGNVTWRSGVTCNGGTTTSVIFTLPAGSRPTASASFATLNGFTPYGGVVIDSSGRVACKNGDAGSGFSLDGITYDTR